MCTLYNWCHWVQYSQIDDVHIISIIKRPNINFGRHHAVIPKKHLWTDIHITHCCRSLYTFPHCLLSYLRKCQKSDVVGKESRDCTEDSFIDILMFSCLQIALYFSTYVCYKQALVYFQRYVTMWVTECEKSILRIPSFDTLRKNRVSLQKKMFSVQYWIICSCFDRHGRFRRKIKIRNVSHSIQHFSFVSITILALSQSDKESDLLYDLGDLGKYLSPFQTLHWQ